MLSEGSWLCGTSTSLLVSPVVLLAGAAAADPKSAMSCVCCAVVCGPELSRAQIKKFRRVHVTRASRLNYKGRVQRLIGSDCARQLQQLYDFTRAKKDNI